MAGAILGPFDINPAYGIHSSPLLTRPKDVDKRRVILNLSHPPGLSLNNQVDRIRFDGVTFRLKFVSIDNITEEILKVGRASLWLRLTFLVHLGTSGSIQVTP